MPAIQPSPTQQNDTSYSNPIDLTMEFDVTTPPTQPIHVDEFMHTEDYMRYQVKFITVDMLPHMRLVCKKWMKVAEACLRSYTESVVGGSTLVHGGNDMSIFEASFAKASNLKARRANVTVVIFLLNITTIGTRASYLCVSLVDVVIPEGVVSIGRLAFFMCESLMNVTFPRTLKSISDRAFEYCRSIESMDFSHTLLTSIGESAFTDCYALKSMTLPPCTQAGRGVFYHCFNLVPSTISTSFWNPLEVIAFLRKPKIERDVMMLAAPPP
ncbi:hypothetical protein TL16_g01080 [Triparma laevis f. inornata]|uniref:Uncharacterized protein n=1 Tax=Triparma laevis f. inornata TaxID=1714386 RepID=A0A9W7DR90_9STRA|nr:hypothetical protein TL16_g01080 [Triparma laevis f. inornata]